MRDAEGAVESVRGEDTPRTMLPTMAASESTPAEGQSGDGVSAEERAAMAHAVAITESARDVLPFGRNDPSREELLEAAREARADLQIVERILQEQEGER